MSNQVDNNAIMYIAKNIHESVTKIESDVSEIKVNLAIVNKQTESNTKDIEDLQIISKSNNQDIARAKIDKKWGNLILKGAWTVILASIPIILYFTKN